MHTILFAGSAGLLALLQSQSVAAVTAPTPIVERERVSHGDLDLATPEGADTMLGRLEAAAADACGGAPAPGTTAALRRDARQREYRRCRVAAIDAATIRLGAPLVRAAWLEREEAMHAAAARQRSAELLRAAGMPVPADMASD